MRPPSRAGNHAREPRRRDTRPRPRTPAHAKRAQDRDTRSAPGPEGGTDDRKRPPHRTGGETGRQGPPPLPALPDSHIRPRWLRNARALPSPRTARQRRSGVQPRFSRQLRRSVPFFTGCGGFGSHGWAPDQVRGDEGDAEHGVAGPAGAPEHDICMDASGDARIVSLRRACRLQFCIRPFCAGFCARWP